jgi:hypothetical protein
VFLVREWDWQKTGSSCCGTIGGEGHPFSAATEYRHCREEMERSGLVYEALRETFEDLDVTVVDPRNTMWLLPAVYRDARRRGLGRAESLRQMARSTANGALVMDGRVLFDGRVPPSPAEAVAAVRAELSGAAPGG